MKIFTPEYYRRFRCVAAACEDSCCKEWEVDVDPQTADFYRGLDGDLGDRLRQVLRSTEDGASMEIENGRCPMWRDDGLCRIQAELGHEALCHTCRTFPRMRHDYGDFAELGLEMSCPEAARLIFAWDGRFSVTEEPGGEEPDYDRMDMQILLQSRQQALEFLEDRRYSVPEALAALLLYGYAAQDWLDGGEPVLLDPEGALADAGRFPLQGDIRLVLEAFLELEILTPAWRERLEQADGGLYWREQIRSMAKYMLGRYYLQAVSDFDLVGRVKLAVIACILVAALGGDPAQTAQQFSKEIENDPENVQALLDGAYENPAFTDLQLLGLLLR